MNRRGFTLVELLAVIIILALIVGIAVVGVNAGFGEAKKKSEDVYLKTLREAIGVYLNTDGKNLTFSNSEICTVKKALNDSKIYESERTISFKDDIIGSTYQPIMADDMINPANERSCKTDVAIRIFRDEEYVYYYSFYGRDLNCLEENADQIISNLPAGCEL